MAQEQFDIRNVEGFEDAEITGPKIKFIKLLNGTAATKADQPAGTIVTGTGESLEVLAAKGETFKFVPIKFFSDWSIWDKVTRKLIRRSYDKKIWSDGTRVELEDWDWVNGNPPRATKAYNLICYPVSELSKESPEYMILALPSRNKYIAKTIDKVDRLLRSKIVEEKCSGLFNLVIGLDRELIEDKGNIWMEWCNPTFIERLDVKFLDVAKEAYSEVKDINKTGTAMIPVEVIEPEVYAAPKDVVESKNF